MATGRKTAEWFGTFDQQFWLKGDDTGQDEAEFIRRALRLRKGQAGWPCILPGRAAR